MMARETWSNPESWQNNEIRGNHVPILRDLVGATSSKLETDTLIPATGRWEICYDYAYREELFTIWRHWCTFADDPHLPAAPTWHQFVSCPNVYYPDQMSIQASNTTPGGCACLTLTILNLAWNAALGLFGGWQGTTTTCPGAGITFKVYPLGFHGGGIDWFVELSWPGGLIGQIVFALCGHRFGVAGIPVNAPGICMGATITVLAYWDWAI